MALLLLGRVWRCFEHVVLKDFVVELAEEAVVLESEFIALCQLFGAHATAEAVNVVDMLGHSHDKVVRLEGPVALEALLAE